MNHTDTIKRLQERDAKIVNSIAAGLELNLRDVNECLFSMREAVRTIKRQDELIARFVKYARNIAEQDCDCDGDTFLCPVCGLRGVLFDAAGDEKFRRDGE